MKEDMRFCFVHVRVVGQSQNSHGRLPCGTPSGTMYMNPIIPIHHKSHKLSSSACLKSVIIHYILDYILHGSWDAAMSARSHHHGQRRVDRKLHSLCNAITVNCTSTRTTTLKSSRRTQSGTPTPRIIVVTWLFIESRDTVPFRVRIPLISPLPLHLTRLALTRSLPHRNGCRHRPHVPRKTKCKTLFSSQVARRTSSPNAIPPAPRTASFPVKLLRS